MSIENPSQKLYEYPEGSQNSERMLEEAKKIINGVPCEIFRGEAMWMGLGKTVKEGDPDSKIQCCWPGSILEIFMVGSQINFLIRSGTNSKSWTVENPGRVEGEEVYEEISSWVSNHSPYKSSKPLEIPKSQPRLVF